MQTNTSEEIILKTIWRCPSNIAIVKYWGKYGNQLPCNSSLSLTLSQSFTEIELNLRTKKTKESIELEYFFEEEKNEKFAERVGRYLQNNAQYFPFLSDYALVINSKNSFPHSAGIASSAAAFGAIAVALLDASYQLEGRTKDEVFYQTCSNLSRLGSGSASRSMFPSYAMWGENSAVPNSSNEYAIAIKEIHPNFQTMQDAILIVEDEPKKVSSSVGHALMNNHVYAENRFKQAHERTAKLIEILKNGDFDEFIKITESEALTLHAMMMTSEDYYLLMKPGTIAAIEKLFEFRKATQTPVCFTLDAGPNLHILYPENVKEKVENFIKTTLNPHYKKVIYDSIGQGPVCLSEQ